MTDRQIEQPEITHNPDLDSVLTDIQKHCINDEAGGIFLFPQRDGLDPEVVKREKAANLVYDMLMTTLGDIGTDAIKEGRGNGPHAQEYVQVAHAIERIACACRG